MKGRKAYRVVCILIMICGLVAMAVPSGQRLYRHHTEPREEMKTLATMNALSSAEVAKLEKKAAAYDATLNDNGGSIIDPFVMDDVENAPPLDLHPGQVFGYMVIPKLDLRANIYLGADATTLDSGVAHVSGTQLPIGGERKRSVIAGHRGARAGNFFRYLDVLASGDLVYIYSLGHELVYQVQDSELIYPSENEKLLPKDDADMLTLLTCHPYPTDRMRLLVNCVRVPQTESASIEPAEMTVDAVADVAPAAVVQHALVRDYVMFGLLMLGILFLLGLLAVTIRRQA